jgi:hypothetical protein
MTALLEKDHQKKTPASTAGVFFSSLGENAQKN